MRIGMMLDLYKPHISGVTNYVDINKRILEQAGHEVFVFTFGDENYSDGEKNVIRTHGLPIKDTGIHLNLTYSKHARQVLFTMDLVHVHHPFLSGSLALRYCTPRGIPIVFTNHTRYDLYARAYLPMIPEVVGEAALRSYLPAFCKACNLVISPSKGMADVLKRFGVTSEITILPNGVELEPFFTPTTPIDRNQLGIIDKDVVLTYVGRIAAEKNLAFLLRAFNGVALAYPDVHLLVIGTGPEIENLKDQAAHLDRGTNIHFLGFIPYSEVPRYLAVSDAFVTASISEVHPLSVIEAMASKLPILGITSPGIEDTVEDEVSGYLSTNDIAAFTAKMVKIITEHKKRKHMGENAQEKSKQYDIRLTSEIILGHYERLVSASMERRRGMRYRIHRIMDKWR